MQNLNDYNPYVLMKLPQANPNLLPQTNPIFSPQTNNNFFPQISPNYLPTIIPSNEVISHKPQYILIQEPKQTPVSNTSQSSDLMFKNIIQDIILQIFKNYSDIHNKLLLDKEFINNITIQISQKLAQDTNLVHNLSDQISQELVKTLPKKLLQDNDFSKDFIEKIYKDIKDRLQSSNTAPIPALVEQPAPVEQPATEPAPVEQPATEPAPVEQPTTEPAPVEQPTTEPAPVEQPTTEPVPVEQPTTEPVPTPAEQPQQNNKFKNPLPANLEEIASIDYLDYFYSLNKDYLDGLKSDDKYLEFQKNTFTYLNNNISTIFNEEQFKKFIESYEKKDAILAEKILKYFANLQIFTIKDLLNNIQSIAKKLAEKYQNSKKDLFIFILFPSTQKMSKIINGSHFWILLLLYKYLKEEPEYDKDRTFFVKDINNLNKELKMKYSDDLSKYNKKYIFIDDASYQGEMLSKRIKEFIEPNKIDKSSIIPIIPFFHNKSEFAYKDQSIIETEMINPFYTKDSNYKNIFNDIDLVVKLNTGEITTLTTLLGINKYNLPVIFEYNLGDSKNTYTCLFEYGPVFNNIIGIYKDTINIEPESGITWDNYCKKVIKQVDANNFKLINSTNNTIENIKIFDLPGEFNIYSNINTNKYTKCDKSSFIKKAYGEEYYDNNSKKFIDIFDKINFIYDKDKNKDEIANINNILTELITNKI